MKQLWIVQEGAQLAERVKAIEKILLNVKSEEIHVCIIGAEDLIEVALPKEISCVIGIPKEEQIGIRSERYAIPIKEYINNNQIPLIVLEDSVVGKQLGVKLAVQLSKNCVTQVIRARETKEQFFFVKRAMETNIFAELEVEKSSIITVQLNPSKEIFEKQIYLMQHLFMEANTNSWVITSSRKEETKKSAIEEADILFIAGRGIGTKENLQKMITLVSSIGGEWGVTRALVLNGYAPHSRLVGQSGMSVQPRICVTFGVAGAGPFMVGIEKAQTIVAINQESSAPIFSRADYGIIAKCEAILDELANHPFVTLH